MSPTWFSMSTGQAVSPSRRTLRFALPLALVLFAAAGGVSYFGTRGTEPEAPTQPRSPVEASMGPRSPVVSIVLPYEEPDLPPGPHQHEFQIACTTCHSTRLALTQPPFPKAKWGEVVHKMVATYGAPLSPRDEALAVDYLAAIRGKP